MSFAESDLPASYQQANIASLTAQKRYIRMFRGILIATVLAAISAWFSRIIPREALVFGYMATVFVITSLVLTLVLKERRYENSWYIGRAIAESSKTRAWSYMMKARPYEDRSDTDIDAAFVKDIGLILKEKGPLILTGYECGSEISDAMVSVRSSDLAERKKLYLDKRIRNQKNWYFTKAKASSSNENAIFLMIIAIQVLSVGVAIKALVFNHAPSGIVSVLAAFSSSMLAWLQVKKYQETAQAYSVTSQELGLVETLARSIVTEDQFASFVEDAESAISREHTLWIARRTSK